MCHKSCWYPFPYKKCPIFDICLMCSKINYKLWLESHLFLFLGILRMVIQLFFHCMCNVFQFLEQTCHIALVIFLCSSVSCLWRRNLDPSLQHHTVHQSKTRPDSGLFDSDGNIIRCEENGRVGKKKLTLLFPPSHCLLLLTIYSDEKSGNESVRRFWWKTFAYLNICSWLVTLIVGW